MKIKLLLLIIISSVLVITLGGNAFVATSSFNQSEIMDDVTFNNTNTMTISSINTFLNGFSGSCISPNNGFLSPDPTGYSPTNGFTYGSNVTAGQVIYDASQAYGLNPQVILTTIQKEQSLVTGSAGCSTLAYTGAAGYGCPDAGTTHSYSGLDLYTLNGVTYSSVTGTCVSSSLQAGFTQQIIHAAWLLKFGEQRSEGNISWDVQATNTPQPGDSWNNSDDPQSCYSGPMTQGTWVTCPGGTATYYDGYTTIDGTSVYMSTGATASLYYYTPHFSGNENFFNIFTNWFGSTIYHGIPYAHPDGTLVRDQNSTQVYLISNGQRLPVDSEQSLFSYGYNFGDVKFANYYDDELPVGSPLPLLQPGTIFQGSGPAIYVYLVVNDTPEKEWFPNWTTFTGLGYTMNDVMQVPDWIVPTTNYSSNVSITQHPVGTLVQQAGYRTVYYIDPNGTLRPFTNEESFYSYRYSFSNVKTATTADMQITAGTPMPFKDGVLLQGTGPAIYVGDPQASDGTQQKSLFTSWYCFQQLGYTYPSNVLQVQQWELDDMPQKGPAC